MTVNEIAETLNVPIRKVTYTIGALKRCGKISDGKTVVDIQEFVLQNGKNMTNDKMASALGVEQIRVSAAIAALKRAKKIDGFYLLTDILPKQVEIKTEKRGRKAVFAHISESKARKGKAYAREIMVAEVVHSEIKSGKIMSLPASQATIERKIYRSCPFFSFDVAEMDTNVFFKLLETTKKERLPFASISNCKIETLIEKSKKDEYAHLILDYCANLQTIYKDLENVFKKDIVQVGGVIAVTFSVRHSNSYFIETMLKNEIDIKGKKNKVAFEKFVKQFCGYEVIREFSYRDGTPMMLIIVKRIK